MKVKLDFVTNSSSVSFVVIGINIDIKDIPKDYLKQIAEKRNIPLDEVTDEDPYEILQDLIKGSNLEYSFGCEYDEGLMVGISYSNMKDDETLGEFKKKVKLQILEHFGIPCQPGHIEECWRDG